MTVTDSALRSSASSFGTLVGGGHVGYARSLPSRLVLGAEAALVFPNFLDGNDRVASRPVAGGQLDETLDSLGALRGRIGYLLDGGLIYGTGGLAGALSHFTYTQGSNQAGQDSWHARPGWSLGAGVQIALSPGWLLGLEYNFDELARTSASYGNSVSADSTIGVHTIGLRLDWLPGSSTPHAAAPATLPAQNQSLAPESAAQEPTPTTSPAQGQHREEGPARAPTVGESARAERPVAPEVVAPAAETQVGPEAVAQPEAVWNIHGQFTYVEQGYPAFRSPYEGANSLTGSGQIRNTASATLFVGIRPWQGGHLYINPELMQGFGLNDVHGVAAFPNGEAQKSSFPIPRFNLARLYLSQAVEFGGEQEVVEDGPNQLAETRSISRLTFTAGKFATPDFFLVNAFAGEPRTTFLNWNMYGGGSYDWTMDKLSWTWGGLADLNQKSWALRAGYFLLPVESNSNYYDTHLFTRGQYLAELELRYSLFSKPGSLRLFGWLSHGNMGGYGDALDEQRTVPGYPDITTTRRERTTYGFVAGADQTISDDVGMFSRLSWTPGQVEGMGWTDCHQSASLGVVVKGRPWGRPRDLFGLGAVIQGLSPVARRYFAAGGMGILIGDGALNYRSETAAEAFYSYSPVHWAAISADYQLMANPGYNADRGPVSVFSGRLHASF